MTNIHPLFQAMIESAFPALNTPAPAIEAEDDEEYGCEFCGCDDIVYRDDSDPSVGYYDSIPVCTACGRRAD
jgi:hypothetical protein